MKFRLKQKRLEQTLQVRKLWHNRDFCLFWLADAVSLAGTLITTVALPILVFRLTGSAFNTIRSLPASEFTTTLTQPTSASLLKRTGRAIGEGLQFTWQHPLVRMMTLLVLATVLPVGR